MVIFLAHFFFLSLSCLINMRLVRCFLDVFFIVDDDFDERQAKRASKKAQRKEFLQRMHVRNGNAWLV